MTNKNENNGLREQLAGLRDKWHKLAIDSREESGRIRRTVMVATDAESKCLIRAEVWDKNADEIYLLLAAHPVGVKPDSEPWLYAITEPSGAWHDGENCVFGDKESAQDGVHLLNDNLEPGEEEFKLVPLYRAAPQPVQPDGEREEFAKHAPKFNSKTGQVSCKCGASLSFVSSVGPAAKEALIEAVAYQYGSHLFWLAAQPAPPQPEGERELIAKTLYELHSGNSLSSWETHAPWLREMRYREADVILAALAPLPSVQPEGERVREALQDLFNNEFCSCRKTEDRCVLCRIAISEARAALAATPTPAAPSLNADIYFDECECYFELPQSPGTMQDATEILSGYDTEVRLAAIAFARAYFEAAALAGKPEGSEGE